MRKPGFGNTRMKVGFYFTWGGIGDFIMYAPGVKFAMDANKHLFGYIFTPPFFYDLAKHWFGEIYDGRFQLIQTNDPRADKRFKDVFIIGPNEYQLANSHVIHPHHLGFVYYSQSAVIPKEYNRLLPINGDERDLSKYNLPERYAVMPVMATSKIREMKVSIANDTKDYLLSLGITPVYIGKKSMTKRYEAWSRDVSTEGVIDLREQTDLVEAAAIMANAQLVLGMDCGMLHLANCSNVSTIWLFTSVNPDLRLVERDGLTISVIPHECRFCESDFTKFFPPGTEKKDCIFKDFKCLNFEMVTIRTAIDKVLSHANSNV